MDRFHSRQGGSINCWITHKTICFWGHLKAEIWNNQDTFYHHQCEILISFNSTNPFVKISALNILGHMQTEQLLGKSLHNNSTSFSRFSVRAFAGLFIESFDSQTERECLLSLDYIICSQWPSLDPSLAETIVFQYFTLTDWETKQSSRLSWCCWQVHLELHEKISYLKEIPKSVLEIQLKLQIESYQLYNSVELPLMQSVLVQEQKDLASTESLLCDASCTTADPRPWAATVCWAPG